MEKLRECNFVNYSNKLFDNVDDTDCSNEPYLHKRFVMCEKSLGYGGTFHNYSHKDRRDSKVFYKSKTNDQYHQYVESIKVETEFDKVADYYEEIEKSLEKVSLIKQRGVDWESHDEHFFSMFHFSNWIEPLYRREVVILKREVFVEKDAWQVYRKKMRRLGYYWTIDKGSRKNFDRSLEHASKNCNIKKLRQAFESKYTITSNILESQTPMPDIDEVIQYYEDTFKALKFINKI